MNNLADLTHHIKLRKRGGKQWSFLSKNTTNRLRVHASMFTEEQAQHVAKEVESLNPEYEAKVVPIIRN